MKFESWKKEQYFLKLSQLTHPKIIDYQFIVLKILVR